MHMLEVFQLQERTVITVHTSDMTLITPSLENIENSTWKFLDSPYITFVWSDIFVKTFCFSAPDEKSEIV